MNPNPEMKVKAISQTAETLRRQIAKMHDGRMVNPYRVTATISGDVSLLPIVNDPTTIAPNAYSPHIDPKPMITFVRSRILCQSLSGMIIEDSGFKRTTLPEINR